MQLHILQNSETKKEKKKLYYFYNLRSHYLARCLTSFCKKKK